MLVVGRKHAVLHGLDRHQHGHQRRTQLMGNVAGESVLKLDIALKVVGHAVKGLAELANLVIAGKVRARRKVTAANLGCRGGDDLDGPRKRARGEGPHDKGEHHSHKRRVGDGRIGFAAERRI